MSDREQAGLRGPVAECVEERVIAAWENNPESRYITMKRYDESGRLVAWSTRNNFGSTYQEFSTRFTYDPQGRLLKTLVSSPGQPDKESLHIYDDHGREAAILENGQPSSTFEYDAGAAKTRITPTPPGAMNLYTPAVATLTVATSALEADDPYLPMPPGGQLKTIFDQAGQPVEWEMVDANGTVLNRLSRRYDTAGHVLEDVFTMETLPLATATDQWLLNPQLTSEEKATLSRPDFEQTVLAELLGPQRAISKISYAYDSRGRLVEKRESLGPLVETVTVFTYNEQSDKLTEVITQSSNPDVREGHSASAGSASTTHRTERTYSYSYDSHGNWTEQNLDAPAPSEAGSVKRRLKYF